MARKTTAKRRARLPAMVPAARPPLVPELVALPPGTPPPSDAYVAQLDPGSRRAIAGALAQLARMLGREDADARAVPWWRLTAEHTHALRAKLIAARYAPATANKMLSALRGVLRASWRAGLMAAEVYHRAVDLEPVRGARVPKGRALSGEELRKLFREIARAASPGRERDAAMLALAYGCGLRRAELVALELDDYDRDQGRLLVRGKGNKERTVYVDNGARDALHAWLRVRGSGPGPLLLPVDRLGRMGLRRLTPQTIYDRLGYLAERAGVAHFTPHDCRRSVIGDLLDAGTDLSVVQQFVGHASPTTTARYDRRGERKLQEAARSIAVPFMG